MLRMASRVAAVFALVGAGVVGAWQARPAGAAVVGPARIALGSDGAMWFTEPDADRIGRITPDGRLQLFPTGKGSGPLAIAAGPDGNVWFTENGHGTWGGNGIGRITPQGIIATLRVRPPARSVRTLLGLEGITAGPDGNVWFTESAANRIGRITPAGVVTEFSEGLGSAAPSQITAAADGNLWFSGWFLEGGRIGRITPAGEVRKFPATAGSMGGIAVGPDGNVWFTAGRGRVGRITPGGAVSTFRTGLRLWLGPDAIAAGPDGNLWFTSPTRDRVGRITPTGSVRLYRAPFGEVSEYTALRGGIAAGPDGRVWFTEPLQGRIARVGPDGGVSQVPPTPLVTRVSLRGLEGVWV